MEKLTYKEYLSVALILAIIGILGVLFQRPWQTFGSVEVGNQYLSTTTPTVADRTNLCPARVGMASSTTGVLGSVSITGYGGRRIDACRCHNFNSNIKGYHSNKLSYVGTLPSNRNYHSSLRYRV